MSALDWLYGLQSIGVKLGLDNMRRLLAHLDGAPTASAGAPPPFPPLTFHVAGTNGKGSVCACLDAIARAHGLKTGLFTSPHLIRYHERMQVDGCPISSEDLEEGLTRLRDLIEGWEPCPSFFEVTLALAMDHFYRQGIECLVLETGLGGRLDATNAVEPRHVSLITPISHDHTAILGETLEAIAREKAGIFRAGVPVLSAPQLPEAEGALREAAAAVGAPISFVTTVYQGLLGLRGDHQRANAALAVAAFEASGCAVAQEKVEEGLRGVNWPGRFQILEERWVIDGAHNPAAMATLAETWRQVHGDVRATVIFGCAREKEAARSLGALEPLAARFLFTRINSPRSEDPAVLERLVCGEAFRTGSLGEAMRRAADHPELVLITGSLFLAGEALAILTGEKPSQPMSQ